MLASAFGYLLTLILATTLIALIAFFFRMILVMLLTRIYVGVTGNTSPADMIKLSIRFAQPVGFLTSIFHGYASLWMGVVILRGLQVPIDWFLAVFLGVVFLFFGLRRLNSPAEVSVNTNGDNNVIKHNEDTDIIINPDLEEGKDPMQQFNQHMKSQLKSQVSEFMQGNTIVGLIGKVTGVALGMFNYIPL